MRHRSVYSLISFVLLIIASSSFAQTRTIWVGSGDIRNNARGSIVGTIVDIDETRDRLTFRADGERGGTSIAVTADSLVTQYKGFGGEGEVFSGTTGFSRLREGDRVEVRGIGSTNATIIADEILLLGRTSTAPTPGPSTTTGTRLEGTVRSVGTNRFTIETSNRRIITVQGTTGTPVYYRGEVYRIGNIEVGDRVRVEAESVGGDEVRARLVDVLESVSTPGTAPGGRTITSITGRVSRIDSRTQSFRLMSRGTEIKVDARNTSDARGRTLRLTDLQVGDYLEVSGGYDTTNTFRADTVRFTTAPATDIDSPRRPVPSRDDDDDEDEDEDDEDVFETGRLTTVVLTGTIRQDLREADELVVSDSGLDEDVTVWVADDFVMRARSGSYVTADQLKRGDRVTIKAVRISRDRYIAQTIRQR